MLFYLLILAVAILIDYIIANAFYNIACEKGFKDRKYFWYSFLLSFAGYLMVIALPDRKSTSPKVSNESAHIVLSKQKATNVEVPRGNKKCYACGHVQTASNQSCEKCGEYLY